MKPLNRKPTSKHNSAAKFRHNIGRTKGANLAQPMRGGWRL